MRRSDLFLLFGEFGDRISHAETRINIIRHVMCGGDGSQGYLEPIANIPIAATPNNKQTINNLITR